MKNVFFTIALISFAGIGAYAQTKLPVMKANQEKLDIREDGVLMKNAWRIVPDARPDVHETSAKRVTFISDIDSISFDVERNGVYDFVVLQNGTDSAYTQIKWQPSKLDILRDAPAYDYGDTSLIPAFTYQSADAPELQRIRKTFNLDSIAGKGSDVSQFINIMRWVHNTVRHDGNSQNPDDKNIFGLIKACREGNRGVNCRMMAQMLNECYLAMGFKSRYVTCMPRELEFNDCHVINMVYSADLGKWVWMDPTFSAYVMDENGVLLGLAEVRERLVNGKPLILNPDANWNYESQQTKEFYLDYYMAKNLYRMETPAYSRFNGETFENGKDIIFVQLLPPDKELYKMPQRNEQISKSQDGKEQMKYVFYTTHNPDLFWAKPD